MKDLKRTYLETSDQWARFLSSFIHELRTPLASSRMLVDLLAESPSVRAGGPERRYAESLREVVQDIQALVGDAADLARLVGGRMTVRSEEVALAPLVEGAKEAVRPRAWEGGIALTDELDPALPPRFRTDPDRLRQLFVLLLGAAVSHAKSEVLFRLEAAGGGLRAVVSSDGAPFPQGAQADLFEPFHDGIHSSRSRGGRSLALPLAAELARAMGGALQAEDRDRRPVFLAALPALPAD
jgi:signal transduction histidine kinase